MPMGVLVARFRPLCSLGVESASSRSACASPRPPRLPGGRNPGLTSTRDPLEISGVHGGIGRHRSKFSQTRWRHGVCAWALGLTNPRKEAEGAGSARKMPKHAQQSKLGRASTRGMFPTASRRRRGAGPVEAPREPAADPRPGPSPWGRTRLRLASPQGSPWLVTRCHGPCRTLQVQVGAVWRPCRRLCCDRSTAVCSCVYSSPGSCEELALE